MQDFAVRFVQDWYDVKYNNELILFSEISYTKIRKGEKQGNAETYNDCWVN